MLFFAEFVLVRCCGENLYQAWRLYPVITWLQVSSSSQNKFTLHGYSKLDGLIFCAHKGKHLFLDETNLSQFSPLCSVTRMRDGWLFLAYTCTDGLNPFTVELRTNGIHFNSLTQHINPFPVLLMASVQGTFVSKHVNAIGQ